MTKVMKSKWMFALLLAGVVGAGSSAVDVMATTPTPPPSPVTTILGQSTFDGFHVSADSIPPGLWRAMIETHGQSDVYAVDNKFATGATTGWHSHPGPSLIIVVSGSVTNYSPSERNCAGHTYAAGASFIDAGGKDVHMLQNNGATPAETVAVQFIPHGQPRRIDEPQPTSPNCPS
jgi:quercetin dioxygenase-like cupin family protein